MSVIPVKKVRLLVHRADAERVLAIAQAKEVLEFQEIIEADGFVPEINKDSALDAADFASVSHLVTALTPYAEVVGTIKKLVEGTNIDLTEADLVEAGLNKEELRVILNEVNTWQEDLRLVNEKQRKIKEDKELLNDWLNLTIPLNSLFTKNTKTYLLQLKEIGVEKTNKNSGVLPELLKATFSNDKVVSNIEVIDEKRCALTVFKDEKTESLVTDFIKENKLELIQLPKSEETSAQLVERLDKEQSSLLEEKNKLEDRAKELTKKYLHDLKITHDIYKWRQARHEVTKVAKSTKNVVAFEGWCNELVLPKLKEALGRGKVVYSLEEIALQEGEEPPVELKNSASIQPFEIITRLYGLPAHKDLDPTPFLAGFFFLFFGLSLTDVGYGIFLMAVALLVLFYFKVPPTIKLFGKLLFLMGLSSALVGLLFGGYLGIESSKLPAPLQAIQQFDPIGNPLPVFYLALSLGVVQVMFGMMLKIYSEARNKRLLTGLLDQGPWLLLFVSLILFGAAKIGYLNASADSLLTLVYLAVAIVVVASGRNGEGVFGKIQMSLLSLYNSIGYFSDILSYSRLLALGLATSALAFAVNLIAGIVNDMIPYVGAVLAVLILIAGHLFTLVVNTLGAFIHSARLQFVEFFGKFISGTGRTFKPLKREESYITIVKDSG
ncbi:MAG: V-type ATPase 116kDa subunit family protein [Candidatus Paceibacterota bacterium]